MYRFVGLIWEENDTRAMATAHRLCADARNRDRAWQPCLQVGGMVVMHAQHQPAGMQTYLLPDGLGIVLGCLFNDPAGGDSSPFIDSIDAAAAKRIVATAGETLRDGYWGGYVAFINDASARRRYVMRDCSGKIACYRIVYQGIHVVFSDLADLALFDIPRPAVDWHYVAAFIYNSCLQVRDTGLRGAAEILAGERVEFRSVGATHVSFWNPRDVAESGRIEAHDVARAELRRVTQSSIAAWSSVHRRVLHLLSGGLDSAIVLGCTRNLSSKPHIVCLTRYGDEPGEDERSYARMAAQAAGVELLEHRHAGAHASLALSFRSMPQMPKPCVQTTFGLLDLELRNSIARSCGADATWTGQGGDHVFFQADSPFAALDYARAKGVRPSLWPLLLGAARLSRESIWSILAATRTGGPTQSPQSSEASSFLINREALPGNLSNYQLHPWCFDMDGLAPGLQHLIRALSGLTNRHRPIGHLEYAVEHHPLAQQPVMELSLRIPSWLHLRGGRTRSLAREAFRDCVPQPILDRDDKGDTTQTMITLMKKNLPFLRELLLDGSLVREGVVAKTSLEGFLDGSHPIRSDELFRVLGAIAAEVWVQSQSGKTLRAAA
jgi:asparagine synthase (glutamine-hydrolysing)